MIEVLGRRNSLNVQKVMWTLGELGRDYRRVDVAGSFGFPEGYDQLNPNALVPTIRDGSLVLWESNACIRYLARRYGKGPLWPDDETALAQADQWMDWGRGEIYRFVIQFFMHSVRLSGEKSDPAKVAHGVEMAGRYYQMLDQHLSRNAYVAGDRFSMGDIPLGAMSYRYFVTDIERPSLPHVEDWYQRLSARPAYEKHVAVWPGSNPEQWQEQELKNQGIQ